MKVDIIREIEIRRYTAIRLCPTSSTIIAIGNCQACKSRKSCRDLLRLEKKLKQRSVWKTSFTPSACYLCMCAVFISHWEVQDSSIKLFENHQFWDKFLREQLVSNVWVDHEWISHWSNKITEAYVLSRSKCFFSLKTAFSRATVHIICSK